MTWIGDLAVGLLIPFLKIFLEWRSGKKLSDKDFISQIYARQKVKTSRAADSAMDANEALKQAEQELWGTNGEEESI